MNRTNRELFAHMAVALSRYTKEMRRDGYLLPADVLALSAFFADCATVRQDATDPTTLADSEDAEAMKAHPLLTKREAAADLRTSVRSVERLIAGGALAAVKVEGSTRIRRADLETYIARLSSSRSFREQITEKDTA